MNIYKNHIFIVIREKEKGMTGSRVKINMVGNKTRKAQGLHDIVTSYKDILYTAAALPGFHHNNYFFFSGELVLINP